MQVIRFQSTHPVRGATRDRMQGFWNAGISIHAPREGCDIVRLAIRNDDHRISIHAPREGCDAISFGCRFDAVISIHAPREGCDLTLPSNVLVSIFQSTHPVRGCDAQWSFGRRLQVLFQSTHPVRGATDKVCHNGGGNTISIHAPREGCDAMRALDKKKINQLISIHAPREGCDHPTSDNPATQTHFNPRTP